MSHKYLDPEEPGLDDRTRRRRRILAEMREMSTADFLATAVRAGISTPDGQLTANYRHDAPPSICRPTD
jgi:hypothetical protein